MKFKLIFTGIFLAAILCISEVHAQDGQLDKSFDSTGIVTTTLTGIGGIGMSGTAYSTLIQKDGKIVLVGTIGDGSQSFFCLVRYNQNGIIDSTFGIDGVDTTAIGYTDDEAFCGLLQPDGKIIAAGYTSIGGAGSERDFALVRYNTDGSIDRTFGTNGFVKTAIGLSDDEIYSIALQANGKIAAAGFSYTSISNQNVFVIALARYNSNGTLDDSFGTNGTLTEALQVSGTLQKYTEAKSVAIQSDSSIVVGGYTGDGSQNYFALLRFTSSGNLDNTFGSNGIALTTIGGVNDEIHSIAIQKDGKIIAGGYSEVVSQTAYEYDFALVRYNTDGSVDKTFGNNGAAVTSIGHKDDAINSIVIQSDGKIVAAGHSEGNVYEYLFAVARYNTNGSLDNTFGTNGVTTTVVGGFGNSGDDKAFSVAIQTDGKIVTSGSSLYNNFYNLYSFAAVRYTGSAITGVINLSGAGMPQLFRLYQNYPNPFNPSTTIEYDLPKAENVKLIVYDILGREVATLVNADQNAGVYKIQWNGKDNDGAEVASGIYLYSIKAGNFRTVKKMIYLK